MKTNDKNETFKKYGNSNFLFHFQSFVFHELHNETVLCVAFSPDGEEVVAAGQSGLVKVKDQGQN